MDVVSGDRLVSDYLARLHAAAWVLPAPRRSALVDGARRRLLDELGPGADAASTQAALDRLGDPADLVRAEAVDLPPQDPGRGPVPAVWSSREVAAVLLLSIGGFAVPLLGPLVGLVLAWLSRRWTVVEKAVATVLAVAPLAVLGLLSAAVGDGLEVAMVVAVAVLLAGLVPAGYLALVLRRKPPVLAGA